MSNFSTPWTLACQDPLPIEFSSQEYWSQSPFPTLGALPNQGIKPKSLASPVVGRQNFSFLTTSATWEAHAYLDTVNESASLVARLVKNLPAVLEPPGAFSRLGRSLEKGQATHSSVLELPWLRRW